MKKKFSWKSFISFGLFFYFFIIFFSGIILYIAPPGRIANWTDWELIGLTKSQWQTMHTNFAYLFAILSILHLFTINWKIFWSYIKSRTKSGLHRKAELLLASLVTLAVFLGVVYGMPPFSSVMNLGENLKESWEEEYESPPIPHAEEYTITELSVEILKIPDSAIVLKLNKMGISVSSQDQTLKELATQVDLSPQEIYSELTSGMQLKQGRIQSGSGLGRKSLSQIAVEFNIPLEEILLLLSLEGIEANGDDVMRDLAGRYGRTPSEILTILNGGEQAH